VVADFADQPIKDSPTRLASAEAVHKWRLHMRRRLPSHLIHANFTATIAVLGLFLVGAAVLLIPTSASAANFSFWVTCDKTQATPESHVCLLTDQPAAFFEVDEFGTKIEICVDYPNKADVCSPPAPLNEPNSLYFYPIPIEVVGRHEVQLYYAGTKDLIGAWELFIEAPTPPLPPPTGAGNLPALPPADTDPPETTITKRAPSNKSRTTITFKFRSDESRSTFQCKLDKKPWKPCSSPKKVKRLVPGKHNFKVRAKDAAGNVDPSPAVDKFKIVG
jgi:hypothetical protein